MNQKLSITDHSRDLAGLKYVYPVLSRRAGGLSVGINFNTNNACNWRCIYCQVPGLVRGTAPEMDFLLLEQELNFFLDFVLSGDFFDQFNVPQSQRVIKDIAISGNGEPTSLKDFAKAVALIGRIATEMKVLPRSHFVLISNGSLMHQRRVQEGLKIFHRFQGQIWFKLDSATDQGRQLINDSRQVNTKILENLRASSTLCETQLQTCMLRYPAYEAEKERVAYFELLTEIKRLRLNVKKVMLYTLARPSLQPEAGQLDKLDEEEMLRLADEIRSLGYEVSVSL